MSILKDCTNKPNHIAIIMDGNGRWAKLRSLSRTDGHIQGAKVLENIIKHSKKIGIKYLTVYAFSTENWKRNFLEVNAIMDLFNKYLKEKTPIFLEEDIRVVVSGRKENLSRNLIKSINETEEKLKNCESLVLNIAFNYGGRLEIVDSVNSLIEKGIEINEKSIREHLYNSFIPDPDLVIRTGNDFRISNFLLWNIAYSEIYISDLMWPDFTEEELEKAILSYSKRERRYGGVIDAK